MCGCNYVPIYGHVVICKCSVLCLNGTKKFINVPYLIYGQRLNSSPKTVFNDCCKIGNCHKLVWGDMGDLKKEYIL